MNKFKLLLSSIAIYGTLMGQSTHLQNIDTTLQLKAGSCGSPDGSMLFITTPPTDYQELEDGGYCHDGIASTSDVTMCFTFTAGASNILLNAGYSESCANNNFTAFNLYDNTCTLVSTSLNPTGLTIGQQYTWCVTMKAWGGGACNGYDRFCPYWQSNDPLPVDIINLKGTCDRITWTTVSEVNSSHFEIHYSNDGLVWSNYKSIVSHGNSNYNHDYVCQLDIHGANYFKLIEFDNNGNDILHGILVLDCDERKKEIDSVYTIEGMYVGDKLPNDGGVYVVFYKNNSIGKIIKF